MNKFCFTVLTIATLTGAASAGTIDLKYVGHGLGRSVKLIHDGNAQNVFSGEMLHEARNGTGDGVAFNDQTLITFCTEVTQYASSSWKTYTLTDPAAVPNPAMGDVKAQAIADIHAALTVVKANGEFDNDMASAYQIALWEIVYDFLPSVGRSSLDLTTGILEVKKTNGSALQTAIASKVNMFFDFAGLGGGNVDNLLAFKNNSAQDQMIPTPGALALASLGGLLAFRRRRN